GQRVDDPRLLDRRGACFFVDHRNGATVDRLAGAPGMKVPGLGITLAPPERPPGPRTAMCARLARRWLAPKRVWAPRMCAETLTSTLAHERGKLRSLRSTV